MQNSDLPLPKQTKPIVLAPANATLQIKLRDLDNEIERLRLRKSQFLLAMRSIDNVIIPEILENIKNYAERPDTLELFNAEDFNSQIVQKGTAFVEFHLAQLRYDDLLEFRRQALKDVTDPDEDMLIDITIDFNANRIPLEY